MSNPVFNTIPTGINYAASYISLSGTLNGSTNVIPAFYHYLANGTKESVSLMAAGTYSFEIVRDSRWNYDGSYLTVIGSISYLDGTQKSLIGRLNTYMGGIIFSEGPFDFSINDFVTNSFDSFLKVGVFAPSNNVDIGKKFSFTINPITPTYSLTSISSSVDEGSSATFLINTNSVAWGNILNYTIAGVSDSDLSNRSLSGTVTVSQNGAGGAATVSIPIAADNLTEGTETLTISLQGKTASILVNDSSKSISSPTYLLQAPGITVDEGNIAYFYLSTNGISPGNSIAYSISGVNSTDVALGLSGKVTLDANGSASISVLTIADFLTEGPETLTVTIEGASASLVVNDTSTTTLIASTSNVFEDSNAVFIFQTAKAFSGTVIVYTISGVSASDITGGSLSGTAIVSSNGIATISIPIAADLMTEGQESLTVTAQGISSSILIFDTFTTPAVVMPISTVASIPYGDGKYFYGSAAPDKVTGTSFVDVVKQTSTISSNQLTKLSDGSWQIQNKLSPSNSDTLVNVERIEFNDMSVALDVSGPAGQVAKILGAVFGTSYLNNTEYAGIGLAYLDDGMSYLDLCSLAADAAGLSSPDRLVTTLLRNATGFEPTALSKAAYLQSISNGASYGSVVQQIADSSVNAQSIKLTDIANTGLAYKPHFLPATYSLSSTSSLVNEGSNAVFNLKTSNVNVGTELSYTLSGINFSDTAAGSLTGKVIVGTGGLATISIPISADGATEGQETLTIDVQGATASVLINDTSKGSAIPTYTLTPVSLSVNEGELAQVYVNTKNVTAGTVLQFDISGVVITQGDVLEGLSRFVTVTPSWELIGRGLINIKTVADQLTEGPETMFITLGGSTTSIIINDTSVTLVGVVDNSGGGDGGGGGGGGAGGD